MYLHSLTIESMRSIGTATLELHYPGREVSATAKRPRLQNLNLLLGINGAGKTTILRAAAIAALGPLAEHYIEPERFVRELPPVAPKRRRRGAKGAPPAPEVPDPALPPAAITARLALTAQDVALKWSGRDGIRGLLDTHALIHRIGDEERIVLADGVERAPADVRKWKDAWMPIFHRDSPAFLVVGYGASRRVEFDASMSLRMKDMPPRRQRVEGLFREGYAMTPLSSWLPKYQATNPGRFQQVVTLLNSLLPAGYRFTTELRGEDYLFAVGKLRLPLSALSDGYKAFIGWVADLLYHINFGCPSGKRLDENAGVVLIDEIDLHLHPEWQLVVIERLARALKRMQFIVTSHSPLVTSSLEWMNIHYLRTSPRTGATEVTRIEKSVHGLSSDQILTSSFFGLESTRAASKRRRLEQTSRAARAGDLRAAKQVLDELTRGLEDDGGEFDGLPAA